MHHSKRKRNAENTNKEVKRKFSDEEDIEIPKCCRKGDVENINE